MNAFTQKLSRNFSDALEGAVLEMEPFPHLCIDGVFDSDALAHLYQMLPPEELYQSRQGGLMTFDIWQGAEDMENWQGDCAERFRSLTTEFLTQDVAVAMVQKFLPALSEVYRGLFSERSAAYLESLELADWAEAGAINIRNQDCVLPVHLDWPNRLISVVIYLSPDERYDESWGTRLYKNPNPSEQDALEIFSRRKNNHSGLVDQLDYKLLRFIPGRIVAFLNGPDSYHGAEISAIQSNISRRWCIVKGINLSLKATERLFGLPPELRPTVTD